jgi:Flp pilus assembly protein TadG
MKISDTRNVILPIIQRTGQRLFTVSDQHTGNGNLGGRIRRALGRNSEGGALVEFALVAPLMLMLVTGMFGFGFALFSYFQLSNAVDIGARTLAVSRATNSDGTTPDPCATAATAITNAAPSLAASNMTLSFTLNGTSYPSAKTCIAGEANVLSGKTAQVTATYPYTVMLFGWKPVAMTLSASTTELMQ